MVEISLVSNLLLSHTHYFLKSNSNYLHLLNNCARSTKQIVDEDERKRDLKVFSARDGGPASLASPGVKTITHLDVETALGSWVLSIEVGL